MEQSNMTIMNSSIAAHNPTLPHAKRKNNRAAPHGNLQTERLPLGDEAKMVKNQTFL